MRSSPRKQLLVAIIFWSLLALGFQVARNGNTQSLQTKTSQEPDSVIAAIRKGGLREGARIKGHYVATDLVNGWLMYDLESLANSSVAIIIGTPSSASSRLTASGDGIITEYKISVDQVFKGNLTGKELSLITPGGKVTFEDGTSAEIRTTDLGPIKEHRRYIFFLRASDDTPEAFGLTGGGQGLFELSSSDSQVKPLGGKKDVVQKHKNQSMDNFIEEVARAARKNPTTSPLH